MKSEDIKRLNFILYTSFRQFVKSPYGILTCYIHFFYNFLRHVFFTQHSSCNITKEILFIAPSSNNKKAVRTICDNLSQDSYEYWGDLNMLPKRKVLLKSICGLPTFQRLYNDSNEEDRALIRYYYGYFMKTCGYYNVIDDILKRSKNLKLIVMSNDHNVVNRCFIELAPKYGIETLYVQHASITERFPPLHFTYSFLDGYESYEKYKNIGDMRGWVFLTGSPRFDEMFQYKNATKQYDIGIALNMMDSCDKVIDLCRFIRDNITTSIIVRPHPRMGKLFNKDIFSKEGINISDSTQESSFSFLSKIKYMIANESGIHLDAALVGVPSLLYNFSDGEIKDWYSYIKNGLISVCNSFDDIAEEIKKTRTNWTDMTRYYNAAFNTPYDGRIGEIIARVIKDDILGNKHMSFIKSITDYKYDFYSIKQK